MISFINPFVFGAGGPPPVVPTYGDPNYDDVVLLLPMNGTSGSTLFPDFSPDPKTITTVGDTQISTTESQWNGSSGCFDGTGDYLTAPASVPNPYDLGVISSSTNITIEAWIKPTSLSTLNMIVSHALAGSGGNGIGGWYFAITSAGTLVFATSKNSSSGTGWFGYFETNTSVITLSTWQFVSVVIDSGVPKLFHNGVEISSSFKTPNSFYASSIIGFDTTRNNYGIFIGALATDSTNTSPQHFFHGCINDLRITWNVARYTTTFTSPTDSFPITGSYTVPLLCAGPNEQWATTGLPALGPLWGARDTGSGEIFFSAIGGSGTGPMASVAIDDSCTLYVAGISYWYQSSPQTTETSRVFSKSVDGGATLTTISDFWPYQPGTTYRGYDAYTIWSAAAITTHDGSVYVVHNTKNDSAESTISSPTAVSYTIVSRSPDQGDTWYHTTSQTNTLDTMWSVATDNGLYQIGSNYFAQKEGEIAGTITVIAPSLFVARSLDSGATWNQYQVLTNSVVGGSSPKWGWYGNIPVRNEISCAKDVSGNVGILVNIRDNDPVNPAAIEAYESQIMYIRPITATTWAAPVVVQTKTSEIAIKDDDRIRLIISKNTPGVILAFFMEKFSFTKVYVSKSTDSGITWSAPTVAIDPSTYTASNFGYGPTFDAVELANGNICVVLPGVGLPEANTNKVAAYYVVSTDNGSTFSSGKWAYNDNDMFVNGNDHDYYFYGHGFEAVASGNSVVLIGSGWNGVDLSCFRFTPEQAAASTSLTWIHKSYPSDQVSNGPYGTYTYGPDRQNRITIGNTTYTTYQGALTKIDQYGNIVWSKTISDTIEFPSGAIVPFGSNILFVHSQYDDSLINFLTLKEFNTNGALIGESFYDMYPSAGDFLINLCSVSIDSSQNIYVIFARRENGGAGTPLTQDFIEVAKFDSNRAFLWRKQYAASGSISLTSSDGGDSLIDSSGNLIVVGEARSSTSNQAAFLKIDSSGNVIWLKASNNAGGSAFSMCRDSSDNIYCTGYFENSSLTQVIKLDSTGVLQWCKSYGTTGFGNTYIDAYMRPCIGIDNKLYIGGFSIEGESYDYTGFGKIEPSTGSAIFFRKYKPLNNVIVFPGGSVNALSNGVISVDSYINGIELRYILTVPYDGSATGTYGDVTYSSTTYTENTHTPTISNYTGSVQTSTPAPPTTLARSTTVVDVTSKLISQTIPIPSGWTPPP